MTTRYQRAAEGLRAREVRVEFHWDFLTFVSACVIVIAAVCICIEVSQ